MKTWVKILISCIAAVFAIGGATAVAIFNDWFEKNHVHKFENHLCDCGEYDDTVAIVSDGVIYESITDIVEAAPTDGTEVVITLYVDITNAAFKVIAGQNITIDLNGHKLYVVGPGVGSTGTETLGFQLLKGAKVTFKDGTIAVAEGTTGIKMLIQNYCDLTLEDVIVDGRNLDTNSQFNYTVSNNCGNVVIKGSTEIYATENRTDNMSFALDACRFSTYTDGVTVTFVDFDGIISGAIEISGNAPTKVGEAKIIAPNGTILTANGIYYFI